MISKDVDEIYSPMKNTFQQKIRQFTVNDSFAIDTFEKVAGISFVKLQKYLSGKWEWFELWDYNCDRVDISTLDCKCRFEGIRKSERRKGYPSSIRELEAIGLNFTCVSGGHSWYEDGYYQCLCGEKWKEVFFEAMQYNGNHAFPIEEWPEEALIP